MITISNRTNRNFSVSGWLSWNCSLTRKFVSDLQAAHLSSQRWRAWTHWRCALLSSPFYTSLLSHILGHMTLRTIIYISDDTASHCMSHYLVKQIEVCDFRSSVNVLTKRAAKGPCPDSSELPSQSCHSQKYFPKESSVPLINALLQSSSLIIDKLR